MKYLFHKIYGEAHLKDHPRVKEILMRLQRDTSEVIWIEDYRHVFEEAKPYRSRDTMQSLILAEKRGAVIKRAPWAYGAEPTGREEHFYFVHAYNCIYSCTYCYLQGYFKSPDILLFVNHETILNAIREQTKVSVRAGRVPHFHSGEFSDSLALAPLSGELSEYFSLFRDLSEAYLELRTKSAHIAPLLAEQPLENVITSFSFSPESIVREHETGTASLSARIAALGKLAERGFTVAAHLDPIIYTPSFQEDYQVLARKLRLALSKDLSKELSVGVGGEAALSKKTRLQESREESTPTDIDGIDTKLNRFDAKIDEFDTKMEYLSALRHISLGVLRFSQASFRAAMDHYPLSSLFGTNWQGVRGTDGKVSYPRPLRQWILREVQKILLAEKFPAELIYLAMEDAMEETAVDSIEDLMGASIEDTAEDSIEETVEDSMGDSIENSSTKSRVQGLT